MTNVPKQYLQLYLITFYLLDITVYVAYSSIPL